jgi:hypothetical protein
MATQSREISPGQASFIIRRLIAERRLSAADVRGYLDGLREEIATVERELAGLRSAAGLTVAPSPPPAPTRAHAPKKRRGRQPGSSAKPRKNRRRKSPDEIAASRKLQGRYLGLLRRMPEGKREIYRRIARSESREAAIQRLEADYKK